MDGHSTPTDHRGLTVLGLGECLDRIRGVRVGRLAFVHDGDLVVLPVNHGVDGQDVVFRTTWGSKLQHAQQAGLVAFEFDDFDEATGLGWSVLVSGVAETVYDDHEIARLEDLGVRSWAGALDPLFWVRVRAEQVTGREITRQ